MRFLLKNLCIFLIFFSLFSCLILAEQLYLLSINLFFIDYLFLIVIIFIYDDISLIGICFIVGIVKDIIIFNPILGVTSLEYIAFYLCVVLLKNKDIEKKFFYPIIIVIILIIKIITSIFYKQYIDFTLYY